MRGKLIRAISAGCLGLASILAVPGGAAAQAPGKNTLVIARATDAPSLDPHVTTIAPAIWVYANIYDTLVEQDRDLSIKPSLAESWQQVSPTTWRFNLRRGVKFHDGTPFNAEAVKFTFDRSLNKTTPARGLSMAGPISGVSVVDEFTVEISTPEPFGPFLAAMSEVFVFGIVSPTAVKKFGQEYGRNPVGTGPFALESWQQNSQIVLKRNDNYWGPKPSLEKVVFKVIPESSSQVLAYGAGEVDGIIAPDASVIPRLRADQSGKLYEVPGVRLLYAGFNTKRPVFTDVRVRRAFNHAINTKVLAERVLRGAAVPAEGYLPKQVFGYYDAGTYKYDPDTAKKLLAEAGWTPNREGKLQKDGHPLAVTFWGYSGRDPSSRLLAEAVQGDLERIGVTVNLRIWDYPQLSTALWQETPKEGPQATQYDMYMLGWGTITGDADFTLYGTISDISIPPQGLNANFWAPEPYMAELKKGRFSTDSAVRKAAYKAAQEMLHENAIWAPLVVLNQVAVFKNNVKGYVPHPVEYYMVRLREMRVER